MTLVQLEYIVAVDTYKSFISAAEKCFVTQPTLSMQIQKLEDFLKVKIFDRSKQPIITTEIGVEIVNQARKVLNESAKIKEIINNQQDTVIGELRIGIIPTIAPYLLPEVIVQLQEKYPDLQLFIWEITTDDIIRQLVSGEIDCGILATPLENNHLIEYPLYYEPFVAYLSDKSALVEKEYLSTHSLNNEDIWLLNEGHCLRSQVINICKNYRNFKNQALTYHTGSIETLLRLVDLNNGTTLLPELAVRNLHETQLHRVKHFKEPKPVREISVVTHQSFVKKRMLLALQNEIKSVIPTKMLDKHKKEVIAL